MKAILVDDEPDGIRTLAKMLERYCPQSKRCGYMFQVRLLQKTKLNC
jgi:hypothetical protein